MFLRFMAAACVVSAVGVTSSGAAHAVARTAANTTPSARQIEASARVSVTEESYGPDPAQVVTVSRPIDGSGKTVILLHGGSWRHGSRASVAPTAAAWAEAGWVAINVNYRLGVLDGVPDDGKAVLDDVETVLTKYRTMPYVDRDKIVLYGESAGGHLATWLGSYRGDEVAATIAVSPVSSISGAIKDGRTKNAPENVRTLGKTAEEFFGYSPSTTDAHRYLDHAQGMFIAVSTDEWVDPDVQGRVLCTELAERCRLAEYPGTRHANRLVKANPQLSVDAREWAETQLPVTPVRAVQIPTF